MSNDDRPLRQRRARRRLGPLVSAAVLVLGAALASVLLAAAPASARSGPTTPSGAGGVEPVPSTTQQLLAGPTTAAPTTAPSSATGSSSTGSAKQVTTQSTDSKKVWAVVAGLVLVAIGLLALTVLYARRTRPSPGDDGDDPRGRDERRPPASGPDRATPRLGGGNGSRGGQARAPASGAAGGRSTPSPTTSERTPPAGASRAARTAPRSGPGAPAGAARRTPPNQPAARPATARPRSARPPSRPDESSAPRRPRAEGPRTPSAALRPDAVPVLAEVPVPNAVVTRVEPRPDPARQRAIADAGRVVPRRADGRAAPVRPAPARPRSPRLPVDPEERSDGSARIGPGPGAARRWPRS